MGADGAGDGPERRGDDRLERWGLVGLVAADGLVFAAALALWASGSEPAGLGLAVVGLVVPLAILAVALDGL